MDFTARPPARASARGGVLGAGSRGTGVRGAEPPSDTGVEQGTPGSGKGTPGKGVSDKGVSGNGRAKNGGAPGGNGPSAGGAPTQRETVATDTRRVSRLRAMFPWPSPNDDPVTVLVRTHRQIHTHADANILRRGHAVAERMHRGQMRKSGQPYITHPVAVAQILAELGMDTTTLVAALLHDTVEDTSYTLPALRADFGPEVALLVDGVTKFDKVYFGETAEAETIRKMLLRAGQDVRVLVIKLADRLHNMRTLDARSPASRARIARATSEVLIPLCERLGIQQLKRELEDTVLWNLHPEDYGAIHEYVADRPHWKPFLDQVIGTIQPVLAAARIRTAVSPRPRHYYSIWRDGVDAEIPGPREVPRVVLVIDGPQTDCYAALGLVHATWRPVPGRFKDFIASPKNNLYRSLHTTVLGPEHTPVEVLIRTEDMHRAAEYGIVASFRFPRPSGRGVITGPSVEDLAWLRRVLSWQDSVDNADRFLDALRCDLSPHQILVFTSDGEQVVLPAGSTPVDLAYTLDAETGHSCIGAALRGRLIPLSSPLEDGDVVEIIKQSSIGTGPSRDWLGFVRTPHARLTITQWFAEDKNDEPISIAQKVILGRAAIGLALRQQGRRLAGDAPLQTVVTDLGFPDLEAMLVAIAEHRLPASEVVERMITAVDRPMR